MSESFIFLVRNFRFFSNVTEKKLRRFVCMLEGSVLNLDLSKFSEDPLIFLVIVFPP